jgi:hypothetical protein
MAFAAIGQLAAWDGCSASMLETHLFFLVSVIYFHFYEYSNEKTLMQ